jgi:integrase
MKAYSNSRRRQKTLTLRRLRRLHLLHFGDQVRRGMRSRATLSMHETTWRFIIDHFGAGADAKRLSRDRLKRWIAAERRGRLQRADGSRRELSPASIRMRVCTLRAALKIARREGLIRALPEFPETAFRYTSRTQWLESFTDYERIMGQLSTERQEYFALLIWTWQHPSDVERMTRGDIDPFADPPWVNIRNSKNRRGPLRVVAPAELARVFRAKFEREGGMRRPSSERLVAPWPARVRTLPAVCERLGLPRITATAARHTGISWAIRKLGITPAVMAWSGHASPKMIATIYGHALTADLADVASALDSIRRARRARAPQSLPKKKHAPGRSLQASTGGLTTNREKSPPGRRCVPRDRIELSTHGFSEILSGVGSTMSSGLDLSAETVSPEEKPPWPIQEPITPQSK